jgi:hypothetical protein
MMRGPTNKRDGKGIQDKGGEDMKIEIIALYFSLHSLVLIYILIVIYLLLRQSYIIYQCNLLTVSIYNGYVPEWIDE